MVAVRVTTSTRGTVTIEGDKMLYTPVPGFVGSESFVYTVCDDPTDRHVTRHLKVSQ